MSRQSSEMPKRSGELRTGAVTSLEDPPLLTPDGIVFKDRRDAGRRLAEQLEPFRAEQPVVVGIPRGGVPVAAEVARALGAPLDVAVVRKIGAPQNPEFAIGALAEGGVHVLSEQVVRATGLSEEGLRALIEGVERELDERIDRYRGAREPVQIEGRTVILVDDGLATGRSALAAVISLRKRGARRVILAVPVAAPTSVEALRAEADDVVCVEMPADMWAVGLWYEDFSPTSDEEVAALLAENAATANGAVAANAAAAAGAPPTSRSAGAGETVVRQVAILGGPGLSLAGELRVPQPAHGVVAFAHGSGSSRLSPRNRAVAQALNEAGFATLLFDLLTPEEERDRNNVFDIPLLASRLLLASAWLGEQSEVAALALGYFGASTGAAAALTAAAQLGDRVSAVVSRGGRPDLARELGSVRAPTLLIVGGADREVLALNREAQRQLVCPNELAVVPGATHLFEEPGALERVCRLAVDWLDRHLM